MPVALVTPFDGETRQLTASISFGDELLRRRRRLCYRNRKHDANIETNGTTLPSARDEFDTTFLNEEHFVDPAQMVDNTNVDGDAMFDDYFDEAIFEAHLRRIPIFAQLQLQEKHSTPLSTQTNTLGNRQPRRQPGSVAVKTARSAPGTRAPVVASKTDCRADSAGQLVSRLGTSRADTKRTSRTSRHPETLHVKAQSLQFNSCKLGSSIIAHLEICNGFRFDANVTLDFDSASFASKHDSFKIKCRSRVRVPIHFVPACLGSHTGVATVATQALPEHGTSTMCVKVALEGKAV